MLVYNTSLNELDVYDSATGQWEAVGANAADAAGSTGQVQFNSGGDLAADSNFFWDNTNKRLGIGTNAPLLKLSVAGNLALGAYGGGASTTAAPSNGLIVSGNVGIGTASPGNNLQVYGGITVGSGTANSAANGVLFNGVNWSGNIYPVTTNTMGTSDRFVTTSAGTLAAPSLGGYTGSNGYPGLYFPNSGNDLGLVTNSLERVRVTTAGLVGIGTSTPANALDVNGSLAVGSYAGIATGASNELIVGGNVGIGTTAPIATLDVNGYAHLAKNASQPIACDAAHDGSLALASTRRPCECVGSAWIDVVYGTACSW